LISKYSRLGFEAKVEQLKEEQETLCRAPDNKYLWITLQLERVKIEGMNTLQGIVLEKRGIQCFYPWWKALVFIPVENWIAEVPESILDFALSIADDFKTLYVGTVIGGRLHDYGYSWGGIRTNNRQFTYTRLDPVLVGSKVGLKHGVNQLAVLGVWGEDWHELDFRHSTGSARNE